MAKFGGSIGQFAKQPDQLQDLVAFGINDPGEVVGTFVDAVGNRHGFVRNKKGLYAMIDVPGALFTVAEGINNSGDIVGLYLGKDFTLHGFVLSKAGYATVDVPGSSGTQINSINAQGEIAGVYQDADGNDHGFVGVPD